MWKQNLISTSVPTHAELHPIKRSTYSEETIDKTSRNCKYIINTFINNNEHYKLNYCKTLI